MEAKELLQLEGMRVQLRVVREKIPEMKDQPLRELVKDIQRTVKERRENSSPEIKEILEDYFKKLEETSDEFLTQMKMKEKNPLAFSEEAEIIFKKDLEKEIDRFNTVLKKEIDQLAPEEIKERAKRLDQLRTQMREDDKTADPIKEELIDLIEMFKTETTPKGYPCYRNDELEVFLQTSPRYTIDPTRFLTLLREKLPEEKKREELLPKCITISRSEVIVQLKELKISKEELEEITKTDFQSPTVQVKIFATRKEQK